MRNNKVDTKPRVMSTNDDEVKVKREKKSSKIEIVGAMGKVIGWRW
jgi:hypothetical protein